MLSSIALIAGCSYAVSFGGDNLLNKVLLFIGIYICGAYYLLLLGVYFIALSYVIVYIGAIAILFLFIIMICSSEALGNQHYIFSSVMLIIGCFSLIGGNVARPIYSVYKQNCMSFLLDIQTLSIYLFTCPTSIILIGILLTSCLIGILDVMN